MNPPTMQGTYIGDRPELKGKTAILQEAKNHFALAQRNGAGSLELLAQFDDRSLPEAYGWHKFECSDFIVGAQDDN